jgi:putative hydrolase of the HAD superfamily
MAPLFIFDLDNTLYPPAVPLWRIVDARIERYVQEQLGTDPDTARKLRKEFLLEFGTTLRGLMHHHDVRPGHYLDFVHDVPVPEIVPPRPELREMLAALPGRRVVFTNGSEEYARRVLDALGVPEMMEGVYGIEFMEYVAKPSPYPYAKLLRATGARAEDSLFCEDSRANLAPAGELGMFTVWVDGNGKGPPASPRKGAAARDSFRPHAVVGDVCDLTRVLHRFPPLARGNGRGKARRCEAAPRGKTGGKG